MAESIRFCLDEHVSSAVAKGLRQRGGDVVTVPEADMMGADDVSILKLAHQEGWTLFTQDSDFLRLHTSGITHAGIVYARQGSLHPRHYCRTHAHT